MMEEFRAFKELNSLGLRRPEPYIGLLIRSWFRLPYIDGSTPF